MIATHHKKLVTGGLVLALLSILIPATASQALGSPVAASSQVSADRAALSRSDPFYDLPAVLPATPGVILKQESARANLFTPLISLPARATRIMYASSNNDGNPDAVTGVILMPRRSWSGPGTRPLIVAAPGTQGMSDNCAPSKQFSLGLEYESIAIIGLLNEGYAVVVPDYEGWGTALENTYLSRRSQGSAVLDAARAALSAGISGLDANTRVLLSGYSQGGGAVAAAAELSAEYAPELNLIGAYAGGVPADLNAVAVHAERGIASSLLLYAATSLGNLAGVDVDQYLNARGVEARAWSNKTCVIATNLRYPFLKTETITRSGGPVSSLLAVDARLSAAVEQQRLGRGTPSIPMLVGQSPGDDIIPAPQAKEMADQWCSRGATVQYVTSASVPHVLGYVALLPKAKQFFADRLRGRPVVNTCGS